MNRIVATTLMVLFLMGLAVGPAPAILTSTFNTGAEGWTAGYDSGSFAWSGAEGNPPGSITAVDTGKGVYFYFAAPNTWDGDWRGYAGGTVSYDLKILTGGAGNADQPDVSIKSSSWAMSWTSYIRPAAQEWTHFSVQLTPANFGVTQTMFNTIMADVKVFEIRGEMIFGADSEALDNVLVTPLPGAVWLLGGGLAGLLGWRRRSSR